MLMVVVSKGMVEQLQGKEKVNNANPGKKTCQIMSSFLNKVTNSPITGPLTILLSKEDSDSSSSSLLVSLCGWYYAIMVAARLVLVW